MAVEFLEDRRVLASAWNNVLAPLNVDDTDRTTVSPIDALIVINELNDRNVIDATGRLPDSPEGFSVPPYLDVNDDGFVSPIDALWVINALSDGPVVDAAIESELADLLAASPELTIEPLPTVALGYTEDLGEVIASDAANDVPPAVAKTSLGGSVVVWVEDRACVGDSCGDSPYRIMSQRFSAAGLTVGESTIEVEGDGTVRSLDIGLTPSDEMILTWAQRNGSDWNIYLKVASPDDQPIDPVLVNETTSGTQQSPAIAVTSESEFAIVWQGEQAGRVIFARYYGATEDSGEIVHSSFELIDDVPRSNIRPDIATVDDGYFVVWTSVAKSSVQLEGLRVQPMGQELSRMVISENDTSAAEMSGASVAANGDGSYAAVVWQQRMRDASGWDVLIRGFDLSAGAGEMGLELAANEASFGTGEQPSIAFDDDDPIVAWNGKGIGGSDGQFVRRYDASGQAWLSTEAIVNANSRGEPVLTAAGGQVLLASVGSDGQGISTRGLRAASLPPADLVAFAEALAASGTRLFGAAWCQDCTDQKELFEDGGQFLPFVEVTNPDRTPNQVGIDEDVTSYPTWEFPDQSRLEGVQSLDTIAERSGVPIPQSDIPFVTPIVDQTLLVGSPLHISLDGYDPNGSKLSFAVTSSNPDVVPTVITGNRSIRFDVGGFGDMVFQLFEQRVPRVTDRMIALSESGFYDGIIFHRVINNFVIQGGDPTGTGSGGSELGDFDDQFDVDLQHNRTGLLSMAKSGDDTNDSQFFVTEGPTRSLDFNHSIFGVLVEGEAVREAISNTDTVGSEPTVDVSIDSTEVFADGENGVVMLKAASGATGTSTITVLATNEEGLTYETSFLVTLEADSANGGPFLVESAGSIVTTAGVPVVVTLDSMDVEGDRVFYDFNADSAALEIMVEIDNDSGQITVTPLDGFVGTTSFLVGVRPAQGVPSDTQDTFDLQLILVEVLEAP